MALGRWVCFLVVVVVAVGGEVEVLFELEFWVDERVDTILLSTVISLCKLPQSAIIQR